jgi:uncharacterized protein (TIGR03643 family)
MNDPDQKAAGKKRLKAPVKVPLGGASGSAPEATSEAALVSELIEMALSDHVSFDQIRVLHGLSPDQVKALMRKHLAPGSYRAWRRRVRRFSDHRSIYK